MADPIIVPITDIIGRQATPPDEPLRFLNLYGLETDLKDCQCSFKYGCEYYMELAGVYGFNGFRVPLSSDYIRQNNFGVLDRIVSKSQQLNMTIMLDYHRTHSSHQGNWYETTLQEFLADWKILLERYFDKPVVRWIDLFNEFQDGAEMAGFWSGVMTDAIRLLESNFPNRYNWLVGGTNWGGSLHGVHVNLSLDNVYYTIHKYEFSRLDDDYEKDWETSFGFIPPEKLIVGEFGWISEKPEQVHWAHLFLDYLKKKGFQHTCFWTLALSGDTGGILKDDCLTLETEKLHMLHDFWGI